MQVSYYDENKNFLFNTERRGEIAYSYTEIVYTGSFLKPKFNPLTKVWYESASQAELDELDNNLPTLASVISLAHGFSHFDRDIDIPIDILEFFAPKEKIYNLKGEPVIKSYIHVDEHGETIPVCDILYQKQYEDVTYQGITKNEFKNAKTVFRFYTKKDKSKYKDKVVQSLPFTIVPTAINDTNGNIVDVMWSSVKREEVLRSERYKAEEVMKTFNPRLYQLFTMIFGDAWQRYKEVGDKAQLVSELNNAPHVPIAPGVYLDEKLQEQVADEDKAVLGLPSQANLTILQLILGSLQ